AAEAEDGARGIPVGIEAGHTADRHDHVDVPFGQLTGDLGVDLPAAEVVARAHAVERVDHAVGVSVGGAEDPGLDRTHVRVHPEIESGGVECRRGGGSTTGHRHTERHQHGNRHDHRA